MSQENWYDEQKNQQFGEVQRQTPPKRSVSFTTLIVSMLVTALLGGGLGSVIAIGGQAQAPAAQSQQALTPQNEPATSVIGEQMPSSGLITTGTAQTYTKAQIVEMTAPSIVGIDVQAGTNTRGQGVTTGSGSGIIVSPDGYIITNNHVIQDATNIKVYLNDDTEYDAELIATDIKTDLAVIKIEATGLKAATMGDSDALVVGEDVVAIGNPLGELRGTATSGMISALSRTIDIEGVSMTLLQTDAAINPGNSGGGLFNTKGQLVGIINAKVASSVTEGLGFAIPVNDAKAVVKDLMDLGYVSGRAYLGIYMENVAITDSGSVDNRERGGYNGAYGLEDFFGFFGEGRGYTGYETRVRITQVVLGSAADKAGLHAGDLILQVGDVEITTISELSAAIGEYNAGDMANIKIQRDTQEITLSVTFGELIPE